MTKAIAAAVLCLSLSFAAGIAVADRVRDWHELEDVHTMCWKRSTRWK